MSIPEIEKFIGTTVTESQFKQAYAQLIETLDLEVANQNLVIDTNIVIDFINNRLNGGGGLVANGSVYIDGIPVGQSLVLEPEDEEYPLGLRKICINKQTKQFKIFNSLEKNSSEYLLLGVLWQRKWMTFSNGPKQPTIIANGIETYKGSIADLKYAGQSKT